MSPADGSRNEAKAVSPCPIRKRYCVSAFNDTSFNWHWITSPAVGTVFRIPTNCKRKIVDATHYQIAQAWQSVPLPPVHRILLQETSAFRPGSERSATEGCRVLLNCLTYSHEVCTVCKWKSNVHIAFVFTRRQSKIKSWLERSAALALPTITCFDFAQMLGSMSRSVWATMTLPPC